MRLCFNLICKQKEDGSQSGFGATRPLVVSSASEADEQAILASEASQSVMGDAASFDEQRPRFVH
jgi:hypothetical protein